MTIVREFHAAFGHPAPVAPPLRPSAELVRLRARLIREEYDEVMAELGRLTHVRNPDEAFEAYRRLLKELADLRYVLEGCAVALGLPIDEAYVEVHRSNMSKLGADGKPVLREDGKVMKGPNYKEPDMEQFVANFLQERGNFV